MAAKFNEKTFNPEAFGKYVDRIPNLKRLELIKSRALKGNAQIREAFSNQTGTAYATIPMFGTLGGTPVNYDGKTDITEETTDTYERGVVVIGRAKAWTELDFSADITGGVEFMDNVAAQVSEYWGDIDQKTLLSILNGIFSMTGAGNLAFVDGHTYDITGKTGDEAKVGVTTLNSAIQQAGGDNKNKFSVVIMHSTVATHLENLNLLGYLKQTDANGVQRDLALGTWNGRLVLIDDDMPTEEVEETSSGAGDGYTKYTSYVLGDGAIDYENIGAEIPLKCQEILKQMEEKQLFIQDKEKYLHLMEFHTQRKIKLLYLQQMQNLKTVETGNL